MDENDDLHDEEQSDANRNRSKSFDGAAVYPPACYNLMPEYDPAQKKMLKALSKQDSEEGAKELKSIVGNLWKAKFRKGQDSSSPSSSSSEDVDNEARVRVRKKKKSKKRRSVPDYSMLNDMGSRHESDESEGEDVEGAGGTSFSPMSTVIKEPTNSRKVKSSEEASSFRRDRNDEAGPVLPERIRASSKLMTEAANSDSSDRGRLRKTRGKRTEFSTAMKRQQSMGSLALDVGKVKRKQSRGRREMVRKQQSVGNLYERSLSPESRSPSPMNKIVDEILRNKKEQNTPVSRSRPTFKRQISREYFSDMDTPHSPMRRSVSDILMDNRSLRENTGYGRNNSSMELDSSLHQMVGRFFEQDDANQNALHHDTGSSIVTGLALLTEPTIDSVEDVENDVFAEDDDDPDSPLSQHNSISSLNVQFGGSGMPEMPILEGAAIKHNDRKDDHGSESGRSWNSKQINEEPLNKVESPPSSPVRSLSEGSSLGSPSPEQFDIYIHDDGSPERLSPWGSSSSSQMQKSSGSTQTIPSASPLERSKSDSYRSGNFEDIAVSFKKEVSVQESLPTRSSSGSYHSRDSMSGIMSDTSLHDDDSDEEPIVGGLGSLIPSSRRAVSSFGNEIDEGEKKARRRSFDRRPGNTRVLSDDAMYNNRQRRWSFSRKGGDEKQTRGNEDYDEDDIMTSVRSLPDRIKRESLDRRASMGSSYAGRSSKPSMSNVVDEILTANDWVADYGAWKKERALQTRRKIVSNQSSHMLQRQSSFGHLYGPRMSSTDDKEIELSLDALKIERGRIASTKAESLLTVKAFDGRSSSSDAPRRRRTTRREKPRRCKSGADLQFAVSLGQVDDD